MPLRVLCEVSGKMVEQSRPVRELSSSPSIQPPHQHLSTTELAWTVPCSSRSYPSHRRVHDLELENEVIKFVVWFERSETTSCHLYSPDSENEWRQLQTQRLVGEAILSNSLHDLLPIWFVQYVRSRPKMASKYYKQS
jgi:hypothetical protein